jgi:hypothetical protein
VEAAEDGWQRIIAENELERQIQNLRLEDLPDFAINQDEESKEQ